MVMIRWLFIHTELITIPNVERPTNKICKSSGTPPFFGGAQTDGFLGQLSFFFLNSQIPNGSLGCSEGDRFNERLDHVTLPSSLRSLTFGRYFNRSLDNVTGRFGGWKTNMFFEFSPPKIPGEMIQFDYFSNGLFNHQLGEVANTSSMLDFWCKFHPQRGQCDLARWTSVFEIWWIFPAKYGEHHLAKSAKFNFW